MKAVLLNDFKNLKKVIVQYLITILLIYGVFFWVIGEYSNRFLINWIAIMLLGMRNQIVFSEKYDDLEKFMTMPVSVKEYSLSKIIKNYLIFFVTYLVLMLVVLRIDKTIYPLVLFMVAIDLALTSFCHIIYTENIKSIIIIIYTVLIIVAGVYIMGNLENLLKQQTLSISISIISAIFSIYADYVFSTNLLKEKKI